MFTRFFDRRKRALNVAFHSKLDESLASSHLVIQQDGPGRTSLIVISGLIYAALSIGYFRHIATDASVDSVTAASVPLALSQPIFDTSINEPIAVLDSVPNLNLGSDRSLLVRSRQPDAASKTESRPEVASKAVPRVDGTVSTVEQPKLAVPEQQKQPGPATAESTIEITRAWGTRSVATRRVMSEGIAAMRGGDPSTAELKFRQVLMAEPDATQASGYLFTVLLERGEIEAADIVMAAALEDGRDLAPLAKLYAHSLLDRGDVTGALQVLEAHRPASSGDPEYAALLAALLQKASRHQEAAQIYEHLLTLDQRAGDWWVGLGIAQDGLGKPAEALQAFQRARDASTISTALADYTDQRIAELQAYD